MGPDGSGPLFLVEEALVIEVNTLDVPRTAAIRVVLVASFVEKCDIVHDIDGQYGKTRINSEMKSAMELGMASIFGRSECARRASFGAARSSDPLGPVHERI